MSNPSSPIPPAQATFSYWNTLPHELHLLILSKTHLVRRHDWEWDEDASAAGPTILHGRLLIPTVCTYTSGAMGSSHCNECLAAHESPFPLALFTVSKQMYKDASEVFWSQRFVLRNSFLSSAIWLNSVRKEHVSRIRKLDLVVDRPDVWEFIRSISGGDEDRYDTGKWQCLIEAILRKCNLERLWLSVNAMSKDSNLYHDIRSRRQREVPSLLLKRTYEALCMPLVTTFQGQWRLERFHVFLSLAAGTEAEMEKAMMGEEYDSALEGKVAYHDRDVWDPHRKRLEVEGAGYPPSPTGSGGIRRTARRLADAGRM